jgi:hypothetical protein
MVVVRVDCGIPLLALASLDGRVSGSFGKEWLTRAESESMTTSAVPCGMQATVGRHSSAIRCGRLGQV